MRQAIMISPGKIEYNDDVAPKELQSNEFLLKIQRIGIKFSN